MAVRKQQPLREPVRVIFKPGRYPLSREIVFGFEDSGNSSAPVTYEAERNGTVVIDGGKQVPRWTIMPQQVYWSAACPEGTIPEQLWVNDRRARRAVMPEKGLGSVLGAEETTTRRFGLMTNHVVSKQILNVSPDEIRFLKDLTKEELNGIQLRVTTRWDNLIKRLDDANTAKGLLYFHGNELSKPNPPDREPAYQLENCRVGLARSGSWFCSPSKTLLYHPLPGECPEATTGVVPLLGRLIVFRGETDRHGAVAKPVSWIKFKGLAFDHTSWELPEGGIDCSQAADTSGAAVMADGVEHLEFEDCEFRHLGGYALWFRHGCSGNTVRHCLLEDLGAGGIRIGEPRVADADQAPTGETFVDNNIIRGGGRVTLSGVGILIQQSASNTISHNEIRDFYYSGISVGWTWGYSESRAHHNLIANNRVGEIGQGMLSDMGGIYLLGNSPGTVVRNNVVHDVKADVYGAYGLYADEGTSGAVFENNLVYGTGDPGFLQHYGRENIIRNNIFANASSAQLMRGKNEKDHLSFGFTRNIVFWNRGKLFTGHWHPDSPVAQDHNLYWCTAMPSEKVEEVLAPFRKEGKEVGSLVADPMFVNPDQGDFRLSSDSPALRLGFVPFDPSDVGVYGDPAWIQRSTLATGERYFDPPTRHPVIRSGE